MENFEQQRYEKAKKRVEREKGFYSHLTVYIVINLALLFINSDFLDQGFNNWFQWHLYATPLFWGIGLFFHWLCAFQRSFIFNKKWEERKAKEFMDQEDY